MNPAILSRLREALSDAALDGYLAYTPSNVLYTSGFASYFAMNWWRMHGTVLVVVPTNPDVSLGMMVSDFEAPAATAGGIVQDVQSYKLWVESRPMAALTGANATTISRPPQFDTIEQDHLITSLLGDRGLGGGRIGTDLQYISHSIYQRLQTAAPHVEWVDATDLMYRIRSIKRPREIDRLRRATELSEAGMRHATAHLQAGMSASHVRALYVQGVCTATLADHQRYPDHSDSWVLPSVGRATSPDQPDAGLQAGDLVKFDCGTTVGGYRSDGGRTFAYRHRTPEAERLYAVLLGAHERARDRLRPGTPIREVFHAAVDHIRNNGYPGYSRGHVGHSVGIDTFHEEPPFISPDQDRPLEPGMVLALETPFYGDDIGAIMIEDLIHITDDGHDVLHSLPYELQVVG